MRRIRFEGNEMSALDDSDRLAYAPGAKVLTNPQIAAQLVISTGTVKTHALTIYRKLEVANRTQAILRAQELGLLHA